MKKNLTPSAPICLLALCFTVTHILAQTSGTGPQQRNRMTSDRMAQRRAQAELRRARARQLRPQIPENYALKMALGVTEPEWKVIKPHFDQVEDLMAEARVGIGVFAFGGSGMSGTGGSFGGSGGGSSGGGFSTGGSAGSSSGGSRSGGFSTGSQGQGPSQQTTQEERTDLNWQWARPSERKPTLTKGERACETLLDLLQDEQADPARIQEKMTALSEIRKQAMERLPEAQEKLRQVLNDRQRAIMTMMGYLN